MDVMFGVGLILGVMLVGMIWDVILKFVGMVIFIFKK